MAEYRECPACQREILIEVEPWEYKKIICPLCKARIETEWDFYLDPEDEEIPILSLTITKKL